MRKARKSTIISSRWWVNPPGYEVALGLRLTNYVLAAQQLEPSGVRLTTFESDDDFCPYMTEDEEEGDPLPWMVATRWRGPDVERKWWEAPQTGMREYEPLKVPGLHRTFAALDGSEASIVRFAGEYGFLGANTWQLRTEDREDLYFGESCEEWRNEAFCMRTLLRLFDLFRSPKTSDEDLSELVEVDADAVFFNREAVKALPGSFKYALTDEVYLPHIPTELKPEPLARRGARTLLREYVSGYLAQGTVPVIDVGPGSQLGLSPTSLLGAMYVLFTQELLGRADPLVRCAACGRWFVSRHASKIYCSDACKMKAYRQSKKGKEEVNG